jgi:hypothetical protein
MNKSKFFVNGVVAFFVAFIAPLASGAQESVDLFGEVSAYPSEDGVVYRSHIKFISVSYSPSIDQDNPFCSISVMSLHNVGCDDDSSISDALIISNPFVLDNYEGDGRHLSCTVENKSDGVYELTTLSENPTSSEKHRFVFLKRQGGVFGITNYAGYNSYYSHSRDRYVTEHYKPIRAKSEVASLGAYEKLPVRCSNIAVPVVPR